MLERRLYESDKSFWKEEKNDELLMLECFRNLYKNDNSEGKKFSSKLMWAVQAYYNYESYFFKHPPEIKISLIEKDFLGIENFFENNQELIDSIVPTYMKLQETSPRTYLATLLDAINKRKKFLKECEYDIDTIEKLDKAMLNTTKIFKEYETLESILQKQEGEKKIKGSITPGLLASGELISF